MDVAAKKVESYSSCFYTLFISISVLLLKSAPWIFMSITTIYILLIFYKFILLLWNKYQEEKNSHNKTTKIFLKPG